ncbi:LodA/GoxA family CTQ-dependent oxidase [Kitasatospora sp. NPDC047058]|uniref:LodA/GoxA family CTQ-dependent oxidase n=1 Tax=Kitasatospora sp. NPDC047058 TaxID=3155620 RepID=UPI0033E67012
MSNDIAYARIHPAIGIARVGNSTRTDGWFPGPEVPDPPAARPGSHKDDQGAVKRQAARFRIYGYGADGRVVRELTTADPQVHIEWSVHVANKKAAWYRFSLPLDIPDMKDRPEPRRNAAVTDRASLVIDPGRKTLVAGSGQAVEFTGGSFLGTPVPLGRMHTDEAGRLVVLGGPGTSRNPKGGELTSYGNNDGWCDDTSDGPVTATLTIGGKAVPVDGAWVVVAPPNYAPDVKTVRTLYDLLYDLFVAQGTIAPPKTVNFERDVKPILHRFCELQWVNKGFAAHFGFGGPQHFLAPDRLARLASPSPTHEELRRQVYTSLRDPARDGLSPVPWPWIYGDGMRSRPASPLQYLTLSPTQDAVLLSWMKGEFETNSWKGFPRRLEDAPVADQPGLLDRAALDFCLADAFHPGCEVTWPVRHATMYGEPLRIRHRPAGTAEPDYGDELSQARALGPDGPLHEQGPGDLTRWMAVPWQTDTASCRSGYEAGASLGPRYDPYLPTFWPARVPNHVLKESDYRIVNEEGPGGRAPEADREAAFGRRASWLRGLKGDYPQQLKQAVAEWHEFGIVEVRRYTVGDGRFPERMQVESTPGFPLAGVSDNRNLSAVHVPAETVATESLAVQAAGEVLALTGLSADEVTIGYFDKLDPFGEDAGRGTRSGPGEGAGRDGDAGGGGDGGTPGGGGA